MEEPPVWPQPGSSLPGMGTGTGTGWAGGCPQGLGLPLPHRRPADQGCHPALSQKASIMIAFTKPLLFTGHLQCGEFFLVFYRGQSLRSELDGEYR